MTGVAILCAVMSQFGSPASNLDLANLPEAVAITAEGTTLDNPNRIAFRFELETSWDWVRLEQWQLLDSFGEQLIIGIMDTWDDELYYQTRGERASRMRRLAVVGDTAGEFGISPIGDLRMMAVAEAHGNSIRESQNGSRVVYSFTGDRLPALVEIEIDTASNEVIRCYRGGQKRGDGQWSEVTYEDWIELSDGTHHPTRITEQFGGGPVGDARTVKRITDIRLLRAAEGPSEFKLPEHVLIEDRIDGVVRRQSGEVVMESATADTPPKGHVGRGGASAKRLLLVGGMGVLILAGVVWQLKRRGIIA